MRVVCPTCDAAYEVPAPVVNARRTLRCTSCGSQFPASAAKLAADVPPDRPVPSSPPTPSTLPDPEVGLRVDESARLFSAVGEVKRQASHPKVSAPVLAGWVLSLVLLAGGAGAALAWRKQIMTAWPPSTRAYAALGYRR